MRLVLYILACLVLQPISVHAQEYVLDENWQTQYGYWNGPGSIWLAGHPYANMEPWVFATGRFRTTQNSNWYSLRLLNLQGVEAFNQMTGNANAFSHYGSTPVRKVQVHDDGLLVIFISGPNLQKRTLTGAPFTGEWLWPYPSYVNFSNTAQDLLVVSDEHFYVAGSFFPAPSPVATLLVRCFANGSIDSTFAPVRHEPGTFGSADNVMAYGESHLLISGSFTHVNGHPTKYLARVDHNGQVDTTFASNDLSGGYTILSHIDAQGRIYVRGIQLNQFIDGDPPERYFLARLLPDGSRDTTWKLTKLARWSEGEIFESGGVGTVLERGGGDIWICGEFEFINGEPRSNLAVLDNQGELKPGYFENTQFNTLDPPWWWDPTGSGIFHFVSTMLEMPDSSIWITGRFHSMDGHSRWNIARLIPAMWLNTPAYPERQLLKVYPNPARYDATVVWDGPATTLRLTDITGRNLLQMGLSPGQNSAQLQLNALPAGMYLVQLVNGNQPLGQAKLIVE